MTFVRRDAGTFAVGSADERREFAETDAGGRKPRGVLTKMRDLSKLTFHSGGPGIVQFTINSACNANCGFCQYARDRFPKEHWKYADRQGIFDAIDIFHRHGVRYFVITGGEPTLHPNLIEFIRHGSKLDVHTILVTNGGLLRERAVHALADAGLNHLTISIDAASREAHEKNRGLPGVCDKIASANRIMKALSSRPRASVAMSRLMTGSPASCWSLALKVSISPIRKRPRRPSRACMRAKAT